jgi:hypothetical protein
VVCSCLVFGFLELGLVVVSRRPGGILFQERFVLEEAVTSKVLVRAFACSGVSSDILVRSAEEILTSDNDLEACIMRDFCNCQLAGTVDIRHEGFAVPDGRLKPLGKDVFGDMNRVELDTEKIRSALRDICDLLAEARRAADQTYQIHPCHCPCRTAP